MINNIIVRGRDQVMIKVTVAEVQRDVIKQLGIDLSGSFGTGTAVVNFNTRPIHSPPSASRSERLDRDRRSAASAATSPRP